MAQDTGHVSLPSKRDPWYLNKECIQLAYLTFWGSSLALKLVPHALPFAINWVSECLQWVTKIISGKHRAALILNLLCHLNCMILLCPIMLSPVSFHRYQIYRIVWKLHSYPITPFSLLHVLLPHPSQVVLIIANCCKGVLLLVYFYKYLYLSLNIV